MDNSKRVNVICAWCENNFSMLGSDYRYAIGKKRTEGLPNFYCSKQCIESKNDSKYKIYNCCSCSQEFKGRILEDPKFCSQKCSALLNNKQRLENGYTTKNKTKLKLCIECNEEKEISIHTKICSICSQKNKCLRKKNIS